MDVGTKIKNYRNKKGITQEQLATELNVARTTISSWETGRTYPDLEMILSLSFFFNTTLDDLLKEDEEVVKKMVKDVKSKKKYKISTMILLIIMIIMISFFSVKLFSNRDMNKNNISDVTLTNNEINLDVNTSFFYDYNGYFLDGDNETLDLKVTQKLNLFSNGSSKKISIPLDDFSSDIKKINILDSKGEIIKTIKK